MLRHAASARKTDSLLLSAVMSTAIAIPALVGICICGIDFSRYDTCSAWCFVCVVALSIAFHILNSFSLKHTEASVFTFLYNLRICIASFLGIVFLNEPVNIIRLAGGGLVFIAGFLIIGHISANKKGILLSIGTALNIAVLNLFEKWMIGTVGYVNIIFPVAIIVVAAMWIIVLVGCIPIDRKALISPSILGLTPLRCISAYGFTLAMSVGALLSVCTYISSLSFITTSLAGILFLKERDLLPNKVISAVIAFGGVTLILISG